MIQQELFSETKARDRKERGIKEALKNETKDWNDFALEAIERLANRLPNFTSDDVRIECEQMYLRQPHHHNTWGAIMNSAAKCKLIRKTGEYRPSLLPSNHGRILSVWKKY